MARRLRQYLQLPMPVCFYDCLE
ncbi:rCG47703, partial [Rattus norvegicus]